MKKRIVFLLILLLAVCALASCLEFSIPEADTFTVSYFYNNKLFKKETYNKGEEPVLPTVIDTYPDDEIDGWYADSTFTKPYAGGTRAYSRTMAPSHKLSLNLDGGEITGQTEIVFNERTASFVVNTPTKKGYRFLGWSDGKTTKETYTVTLGTKADISLTAQWQIETYTITYELNGGTQPANQPTQYTVEDETFTLKTPTKLYHAFLGWQIDGTLQPTVTIEKGTAGNLHFVAVFSDGNPVFTYSASQSGMTVSSSQPAGPVPEGTEITLLAEGIKDGYRFISWRFGTKTVSYSPSYTFTMQKSPVSATAVYEAISTITYDKSTGTNLNVALSQANATPTGVYGAGIINNTETTLVKGRITVKSSALSDLPIGQYTVTIITDMQTEYFVLNVTCTQGADGLSLVYDNNHFPAVEVQYTCLCGGTHTYSLDGGASVSCQSGDVIQGYDKSQNHTLTLTCQNGNTATTSRTAPASSNLSYYQTSFTYGGCTYDFAIGTEEEFYALCEYIGLVAGVLDYEDDGITDTPYAFLVESTLLPAFEDENASKELYRNAFTKTSYPMAPSYQTKSYSPGGKREITISYPNGVNSVASVQPKTILTEDRGLLSDTGRAPTFESFPIDSLSNQIEIRTLYELENLPFGYKPTFSTTAETAQAVYQKARQILREIIDDGMNDYQKAAAIYVYLAMNVTYDDAALTAPKPPVYRSFTSYGALVDGIAVCDGFASAYRLLCQIEGIDAPERTGLNVIGDTTSGHAWNIVSIDGITYGVDATWGRKSATVFTMYYAFMDEETLQSTGHYENAWVSNRATEISANGVASFYEMQGSVGGFDNEITSQEEFTAALKRGFDAGLTTVEVHVKSGNVSQYISNAQTALKLYLSTSALSSIDVYYVSIAP